MLTLCLDEYGQFEEHLSDRPFLTGGAVFICDSPKALDGELRRLQNWFQSTCEKLGCAYPTDLHMERDSAGKVCNAEAAGKVKNALEASLGDFIRGDGGFAKPSGTYHLIAMLGDKSHKISGFSGMGLSNMLNDHYGSNRYEHMAYRTIENALFYTPAFSAEQEIKLELATRTLPHNRISETLAKELQITGHRSAEPDTAGGVKYAVTNRHSYRGMLSNALQNHDRRQLQFDLRVQSINYNAATADTFHSGFLYLADTLCSYLSDKIRSCTTVDEALSILEAPVQADFGKQNFQLWVYDDVDQKFRTALNALEHGNYFECLLHCYDNGKTSQKVREYYDTYWFPYIFRTLQERCNAVSLRHALDDLLVWSEEPSYSNSKARFVFRQIELAIEALLHGSDPAAHPGLLFHFYDIQMTVQNHAGHFTEAMTAYENAKKYSQHVEIGQYLELRNKASVAMLDMGNFADARDNTEETLIFEELLFDIRKEIFPDSTQEISMRYGRTLSQLGQCHAFMGEFEKAHARFETALAQFSDNAMQYQRTLSYYLHSLIEAGDRERYETYAKIYFGTEDLTQQYKQLSKRPDTKTEFALFVYCKALCRFYLSGLKKRDLTDFLKWVEKQDFPDEHPMEIIYKYCAVIAHSADPQNEADAERYLSLSKQCMGCDSGLLQEIVANGIAEYRTFAESGTLGCADPRYSYMYR